MRRKIPKLLSLLLAVLTGFALLGAEAQRQTLLHFDFEKIEGGEIGNCAGGAYLGRASDGLVLTNGAIGRGALFSRPRQHIKVRGRDSLPFAGFDCAFDLKRLSAASEGIILYGPYSDLHKKGFGIQLRKNGVLAVIYSTAKNSNQCLVAAQDVPLGKFCHCQIVYNPEKPSLELFVDGKLSARRDLDGPIIFNREGTASMRIGVEFGETALDAVLDEFKFTALGEPPPKADPAKKADTNFFVADKRELSGNELTLKFLPARDYGIPENQISYTLSWLVDPTNLPAKPGRLISTQLGFTGKPYNRFLENEPKAVVLKLINHAKREQRLRIEVRVDNWLEQPVFSRKQNVILPPEGEGSLAVDLEPHANGCFFMEVKCLEDGAETPVLEYASAYAVTVDASSAAGRKDASPFGHHLHDGLWCDYFRPGFHSDWVRYATMDNSWINIELRPGEYYWENVDRQIDYLVNQRGAKVMFSLMRTPLFYSAITKRSYDAIEDPHLRIVRSYLYPPKEIEPWRNFIRAVVRRYKDRVNCWEIWNEVNSSYFEGSVEEYFQMLKCAYETIKAEDPDALVVGCAFCPGGFEDYLAKLIALGGHNYMDVLTSHFYLTDAPEKEVLLPRLNRTRKILGGSGKTIPIWDGESAYPMPLRDKNCRIIPVQEGLRELPTGYQKGPVETPGERRTAAFAVRQRMLEMANGVEKFFVFDQYACGAKVYSLNLVAHEAMAKNIGDKKFKRQLELGAPNLWGFVFTEPQRGWLARLLGTGEKCTAVFWSSGGKEDLVLNCGKDKVQVADFLGNVKTVAGNKLRLALSDYPLYVLGCSPDITAEKRVFSMKISGERAVLGGDCRLELVNHADKPLKLACRVVDKAGKDVSAEKTEQIAPGANAACVLPISPAGEPGEGLAVVREINSKFTYSYPLRLVDAPLPIPATEKTKPEALAPGEIPQIKLNVAKQVKVGLRNAIVMGGENWNGPDDASAECFLAWNQRGLYCAVTVTDNSLLSLPDNKAWLNDGLELFLALRPTPGDGNYAQDVFHYILRLAPGGKVVIEDFARGAGTELTIEAAWEKTAKGYDVFAFIHIPASGDFKPGREFSFDLALNDADAGRNGDKRVAQLVWRGDASNHRNASMFGMLRLTP